MYVVELSKPVFVKNVIFSETYKKQSREYIIILNFAVTIKNTTYRKNVRNIYTC